MTSQNFKSVKTIKASNEYPRSMAQLHHPIAPLQTKDTPYNARKTPQHQRNIQIHTSAAGCMVSKPTLRTFVKQRYQ